VKTFMAWAHLMARTIDLYAFRIEGEVIDMAATPTRRFGPVLVSTSVHAPEDEVAGPGKAVELSILGSGPRPRGGDVSEATPHGAVLARLAGGGDARRWNAAAGRARLRRDPLRLRFPQARAGMRTDRGAAAPRRMSGTDL